MGESTAPQPAAGPYPAQPAPPAAPVPPAVATVVELLRASSAISAALTPVTRELGLSLAAFNVLDTLAHAAGPLAPKQLSALQVIRPQTLSDILGTLEDQELITRVRERRDRRMLLVALTPAGRSRHEQCCSPLLAEETRLLARLSDDDLSTLRTLLARIAPGD